MLRKSLTQPSYAVIFSSIKSGEGAEEYRATAERMLDLAAAQPGFLGVESAAGDGGFSITVSYWDSLDSIQAWRNQISHASARRRGREAWYREYRLRVCRVERETVFESDGSGDTSP
ncbi:MAG: antibiotic biosynthesis monooxygenase [bacterium]|nr:antibiotic biosynthesis monooxygenase [bacterium]